MKTFTLTDARNHPGKVFDQASIEPVLLTKKDRPTHVVMSAQAYDPLTERLALLEDLAWGKTAETVLQQSSVLDTDIFMSALRQLADEKA
jgi:prevent-host-death family protein